MPSLHWPSSVCFQPPDTLPLVEVKMSTTWTMWTNGLTLLSKSKMKTTAIPICSLTACKPTTCCSSITTTSTATVMLHLPQNSTTWQEGHVSLNTRTSDQPLVTHQKSRLRATSWKIASKTLTAQVDAMPTFRPTTNSKFWTSLNQTTLCCSQHTMLKLVE